MRSDRYLLTGTLTTASPLHLGVGEPTERAGLVNPESKLPVEVNAVAKDACGKPYLPGTALKGALRRAWELAFPDAGDLFTTVFGAQTRGGDAEFHDAPATTIAGHATEREERIPWWCGETWTGVNARVAIDRVTGAASRHRLFHDEMVPPGVEFAVRIAGHLEEAAVIRLLALLEGFNDRLEPLTLGADPVNGWGRFTWRPEEIRRMDSEGVQRWLQCAKPKVGWDALEPLPDAERERLLSLTPELAARRGGTGLTFDITLNIPGPFLVNDPSRTGSGEEKPDHTPRLDHHGRPYLPASSLRGALRGQAERILRTILGETAACGPGAPVSPCLPPKDEAGLQRLCPACRLFGAAGWRTPLQLSDFTAGNEGESSTPVQGVYVKRQQLLAIDRFTGGGATGLKFNSDAAHGAVLKGQLRLDLEALARAGVGAWGLALLALTLRDLAEGDIPVGFGAAKGYGHATAQVTSSHVPAWEQIPASLRNELEAMQVSAADLGTPQLTRKNALGEALMQASAELAELDVASPPSPPGRTIPTPEANQPLERP